MRYAETAQRSIVKSITYRIIILSVNGIIVYYLTGQLETATGFVVFSGIIGTLVYIVHERVWNTLQWGKERR